MKLGRRGPPSERLRQVFSIVSMYIIYLYFNCSFEQRVSLGFSGHSSGRGPVARDHVRCKHFGFRSREICKKMCVCLLKNGLKVWCTSRGKPARWALRARGGQSRITCRHSGVYALPAWMATLLVALHAPLTAAALSSAHLPVFSSAHLARLSAAWAAARLATCLAAAWAATLAAVQSRRCRRCL